MVESYVIQVYRRSGAGRELTGTIEAVGRGTRQHFSSLEELWACLNAEQPRRTRRKPAPRDDGGEPE
jgi:hypothetical protein